MAYFRRVRYPTLILFVLLTAGNLCAQIGGESAYEFLSLNGAARVTASGGQQVALMDDHPLMAGQNPALLNDSMHHVLSTGIVNYFADVAYGDVAYAWGADSLMTFGVLVNYISYGTFVETDVTGQVLGEFKGGDTAFGFAASRAFGRYRLGAQLKGIYSSIAEFNSFGVAADIGASWHNPEKLMNAGLVLKNVGLQLKPYREGNREQLPFDIQIGFTKRLAHVPFRISFQANNLYRWDIRYDDPRVVNNSSIFGAEANEGGQNDFFDNLFRHLIFGGELYLGRAISLRTGFNFNRRQDLSLVQKNGLTGFSFGGSLNIRRFQFDYGFSSYHVAGGAHHFTLSTALFD